MSILWVFKWLLALSLLFHSNPQSEARSCIPSDPLGELRPGEQEAICTSRELTKLKLLTMLPYPDNILPTYFRPSWDQGRNILPAMELAAEQINNRSDILPCHHLELVNVDGGCEIAPKTSLGIAENLYGQLESQNDNDHQTIVGVIGPGCSISTMRMSNIANRPEVELVILHDAGSPLFANRTKYKNSISILGSIQPLVELSIALVRDTKWHNIAILYDSTRPYHRFTAKKFISELNETVNVLFQAPVYEYFYPLLDIRDSLARIIFLFIPPPHSQRIMCLAYYWKLVHPGYQWILVGHNITNFAGDNGAQNFTYNGRQYNCSNEVLWNTALNNSFVINYQTADNSSEKPLLNLSFYEFQQLYEERIDEHKLKNPNAKINTTYWAYNMYDAVWAWACVLDRLLSKLGVLTFEYGNKTLANMILKEFYSLNFQGMSGRITFNSSNGFINRPAILYQIAQGSEKNITSSSETNNSITMFPKDSYVAIPDIIRIIGYPHKALTSVFIVLQCLEFFVVATLHFLTALYRNSKSVKASSSQLSQLIFIGLYLFIIAMLVLSISNITKRTSGVICQILWVWLFPFSFTLMIGTVAVRTWRLYRIFIYYRNPGRFISTPALVIILIILLFINLLIATIWTATDPMQEILARFMVENGPANILMQDRMCRSENLNLLWITIDHGYRLLLLAVTVTLTVLTRNIPNKTFTTSSLGVFSCTFSTVYLLGFTTYYLLLFTSHNPNAVYGILNVTFNTMICLIIACIVLPPLLPIAREKISIRK